MLYIANLTLKLEKAAEDLDGASDAARQMPAHAEVVGMVSDAKVQGLCLFFVSVMSVLLFLCRGVCCFL